MEALVILLIEFLLDPIILLFILLFNVLVCIIELIIELIFTPFLMKDNKTTSPAMTKNANKNPSNPEPPQKRINSSKMTNSVFFAKTVYALKWLRNLSLSLIILIISALFIINFALFEPTVKWILTRVEQKTGIELNAEQIKGNIFTGKISFHQFHVTRESPIKTSFKLDIADLSLDIDWLSLIFRPITIQTLFINQVTGNITQPDPQVNTNDHTEQADSESQIKTKRPFVINNLNVNKINITFTNNGNTPIPVSFDKIYTPKFRSDYAIFDLFFRSNITGSIDGHPILISTSEMDSGRITHWHIPDFPVAILANFVNKPPINWLKGGIINVEVKDKWQLNDQEANIEMDWHLQSQGLILEPPPDIPFIKRQLAFAITHYINSKNGDIDLRLRTVLNENQFKNAFSLDASGLWDALTQTITNSIINKIHLKGEFNNNVTGSKHF
ncbi:hypothetical protein [Legionella maioricensis]|uniref:Transmembrane protein n=1 Tax=Legionella maioricensis TaxID=2896528 RepID=A0A9X2ID31_9GAMM|nr:hypothetical protein [Legionella maioricensis]MCL9685117.1 hypothetical protein [Legionella maioricensis]MCL9688370.1 hypothetical protein [Legionella maioricensis]